MNPKQLKEVRTAFSVLLEACQETWRNGRGASQVWPSVFRTERLRKAIGLGREITEKIWDKPL